MIWLYKACDYLSMLGSKLNHISKRGPCCTIITWSKVNFLSIRLENHNSVRLHQKYMHSLSHKKNWSHLLNVSHFLQTSLYYKLQVQNCITALDGLRSFSSIHQGFVRLGFYFSFKYENTTCLHCVLYYLTVYLTLVQKITKWRKYIECVNCCWNVFTQGVGNSG